MSTQQQIDDPGQWRVGDMFEGEYEAAGSRHKFSGEVWSGDSEYSLYVGGLRVRDVAGVASNVTGHVTRTVEPIPEPTVPWALVRFAGGFVAIGGGNHAWSKPGTVSWRHWIDVVRDHGTPVAVSLPHWSDEVDGLRAGVEELIEDLDRQRAEGGIFTYGEIQRRLRAALAEGGEA